MKTKAEFKNKLWLQFQSLLVSLVLAVTLSQSRAAPSDLDLSFDPGSSLNNPVSAIAVLGDGKVLIGGSFTTVHGAMRSGLARLNADGSVDDSFLTSLAGNYSVGSLAVQSDDKVLVAGEFASVNGVARPNIARLNADGTLDDSFLIGLAGPNGRIIRMLLQGDGKILIGGSFSSVNGVVRRNLARLNPDGSLDESFLSGLSGPDDQVGCLALQNDGKILIGGWFASFNGVARPSLARLNPDGSLDSSFLNGLAGPNAAVSSGAVQTNGQILIGGLFYSVNGVARTNVARLNTDGTLDDSFIINIGYVAPYFGSSHITLQPDGKILIDGMFSSINGVARKDLARLNADGTLDESFSSSFPLTSVISSLTCQTDGRILVGYGFYITSYKSRYLRRLNTDGSLDPSFDTGPTGPNDQVLCVTTQPDGRILIGGNFYSVNGIDRGNIVRLMSDGSLDPAFLDGLTGGNSSVSRIIVQSDGKILVGGGFERFNDTTRSGIVRLNPDGSLDSSFLNGLAGPLGDVHGLALQGDGKILIGGGFATVNGVARANIARLNPDGSLDHSFTASTGGSLGGPITELVLQSDGKVLIGGYFATVNGVARNGIARLNADGSLDNTFLNGVSGVNQPVWAIVPQDDGKVILGGWFGSVNGVARKGIARLRADGSLDTSFLQGLTGDNVWVRSLILPGDGKILVGGWFPTNGVNKASLARLNANGSLDDSFPGNLLDANDEVDCITLQADGKILIGGKFTAVYQTPRNFVARLKGDYFPPTIKTALKDQTSELGCTVVWRAAVVNRLPLTYLWFCDGTNLISCSTNCLLELTNVQFADCGTYTVVVTNIFGAVTSAPVMLNVIARVPHRPVPAMQLVGDIGSDLHVEYTDVLGLAANWLPLGTVTLTNTSQFSCDPTEPLPPQRFYRAWQLGTPVVVPSLRLSSFVPAITLIGDVGDKLRLDYINAVGPTDAWVTLDTITLSSTSQLYFDVSAPGYAVRLYRIVPVP